MNAARYKLMLSYLPGMASIVNSFHSPEVQLAVFDSLMEALNVRIESDSPGAGATSGRSRLSRTRVSNNGSSTHGSSRPDLGVLSEETEVAHDLEEGDSIHAMMEQDVNLP